jgi:predicted permease
MFRLVSLEGILLVAGFAAGVALQRHRRHADLQRWLWEAFFWTIAPAAAIYAYTTVAIDRSLVASLVIVATSSWLLLGLSILLVRFASHDDPERGAVVLAAGWGNTVALGYPLANFAYGADGLALQVLYAQFYYGVPGIAISTSIARMYGIDRPGRKGLRAALRTALNPPVVAAVTAIGLRIAGVDLRDLATSLGHAAGAADRLCARGRDRGRRAGRVHPRRGRAGRVPHRHAVARVRAALRPRPAARGHLDRGRGRADGGRDRAHPVTGGSTSRCQ